MRANEISGNTRQLANLVVIECMYYINIKWSIFEKSYARSIVFFKQLVLLIQIV